MSEIELKFGVPPARAGAIDAALRRAQARRLAIESRYFDTPDRRLAEAGLSLRLRRSAGLWEQTLKAPADGLGERLEETVLRPGRWGSEGPPLDPSLHDDTAAGKRLREVMAEGGDGAGRARAGARLHGRCAAASRSTPTAAGSRWPSTAARSTPAPPWRRCARSSTSSRAATPARCVAFGKDGVREHGLWLSTLSKAARGDRLARGETAGPPVKAKPPVLESRHERRGDLSRRAQGLSRSGAGERERGRRGPSDRRVDPPAAGRNPPRPHRLARARAARPCGRAGLGDAADRGLSRPRRLPRSQHRGRDAAGAAGRIGLARADAVAGRGASRRTRSRSSAPPPSSARCSMPWP